MIDSSTNLANTSSNKPHNYHEQSQIDQTLRLREVLKTLPPFVKDYFRAMEPKSSARTRINYAYDIRVFFHFLMENNPVYKNYTIDRFTPQDLENLEPVDIEEYLEYLKVYKRDEDGELITNGEKGLARKMSALRSFYGYYFKHRIIQKNPTLLVDMPKLHDKAIIRLDTDEVALLLDFVESAGEHLTGQALNYYKKTRDRDIAILTLLLGTGIRVSECVGLDIKDVDFKNNGIMVTRKGGNEQTVYFNEDVKKAIYDYIQYERKSPDDDPDALFVSSQNRQRLSVRSVERMIKKYAQTNVPDKKITPHRLRASYGTNLLAATGDINLVADALGHSNLASVKKYIHKAEENRLKARESVTWTKNNTENK